MVRRAIGVEYSYRHKHRRDLRQFDEDTRMNGKREGPMIFRTRDAR